MCCIYRLYLDCGLPPDVLFANRGQVESTLLTSTVAFECYPEYIPEGSLTIECLEEGWSAPPVCRAGTA